MATSVVGHGDPEERESHGRHAHTGTAGVLRDNPFVGVVTTLREDGSPHSTVVWVDGRDGVSFNTFRGGAKEEHLAGDPRVSLLMLDPGNPWRWVSVDGTATVTEDGADAQIDALAFKYLGKESYPWRRADQTRVTVAIAVERVDSVGLE